jgi:hypothetical protein
MEEAADEIERLRGVIECERDLKRLSDAMNEDKQDRLQRAEAVIEAVNGLASARPGFQDRVEVSRTAYVELIDARNRYDKEREQLRRNWWPSAWRAADEIERLREDIASALKTIAAESDARVHAEAVIDRIAVHTICQGRSVWGCMDMIRDEIRAYDRRGKMGGETRDKIDRVAAAMWNAEPVINLWGPQERHHVSWGDAVLRDLAGVRIFRRFAEVAIAAHDKERGDET